MSSVTEERDAERERDRDSVERDCFEREREMCCVTESSVLQRENF